MVDADVNSATVLVNQNGDIQKSSLHINVGGRSAQIPDYLVNYFFYNEIITTVSSRFASFKNF